jgi:hypothetical protein
MTRRRFLRSSVVIGAVAAVQQVLPGPNAGPRPILHGVAAATLDEMLAFETAAGRFVRAYTYYRSWGTPGVNLEWEGRNARTLVARGTTPVVTFQPQVPGQGLDQPRYSHAAIIAGTHDRLLLDWAVLLRSAGGPVIMRPMHEGNGDWYPWCASVNGNTSASYVAAYRHIHEVMVSGGGATNLRWLWSMNKVYDGIATPMAALYPGDDVVDQVGLSGYNGGAELARGGWRSAAEIFDASLVELALICTKPQYIAETGCVEQGGDKAAWITSYWDWLARNTVAGVTWFDHDKGHVNWRVDTSAASQAAYRRGAIATVPPRF